MSTLVSGSRSLLGRMSFSFFISRSYSLPAVYLLSEFFNPHQFHMVAISEGLRLCHEYGNFSSYAATIISSTAILRTVVAGPLYTFTEKNQTLVSKVYCESTLEAANPRFFIPLRDGKINPKLRKTMVINALVIEFIYYM